MSFKTTAYFDQTRQRPDRAWILDAWIAAAVITPDREEVHDGRIRRLKQIAAAGDRWLRVILLPDGDTVHNAFFDRGVL